MDLDRPSDSPGDTEVLPEAPILQPKKRKLATLREHSGSRAASPLAASGLQNEILPSETIPASQRPSNAIARPPTFSPTSEPGYFSTTDVPSGRNYRYIPARTSPTYDPSLPNELPYYRTSESPPTECIRVSWEDRSPFIRVTEDGLGLMGDKGFRSARLNAPIREGKWFFEIAIINGDGPSPNSTGGAGSAHVRLGWARREASLNAPVGLDGYSYGIRDKTGEKITLSRPRPYGRAFATGDIIGLYISLPTRRKADPDDPLDPAHIVPKRMPIQYKGQSYFESSEYLHSKEMIALTETRNPLANDTSISHSPSPAKSSATVKNTPATGPGRGKRPDLKATPVKKPITETLRPLPILENSVISFFVNGEDQGVAFRDIYSYLQLPESKARTKGGRTTVLKERENPFDDGTLGYYPFISLFGNAKVRINAGPEFAHPPPDNYAPGSGDPVVGTTKAWRPLSERYSEYMTELLSIDEEEERQLRAARLAAEQEQKLVVEKEQTRKVKAEDRRKEKERRERKSAAAVQRASVSSPVPEGIDPPPAGADSAPSTQPTVPPPIPPPFPSSQPLLASHHVPPSSVTSIPPASQLSPPGITYPGPQYGRDSTYLTNHYPESHAYPDYNPSRHPQDPWASSGREAPSTTWSSHVMPFSNPSLPRTDWTTPPFQSAMPHPPYANGSWAPDLPSSRPRMDPWVPAPQLSQRSGADPHAHWAGRQHMPSPETFVPARFDVSRTLSDGEMMMMERVRSSDRSGADGGSSSSNVFVTGSEMQVGLRSGSPLISRSISDAEMAMLSHARISASSLHANPQRDREDLDMRDHDGM
ncbi:hypothetical protein BS47DRAFT_1338437 [Hydnum rufescens UP504]|uniref:B30.2/SPRY domain-containing protein n=1 Tax=Hydnum rufescens UP504 TaxID=1448309 RepID=A0A9P6DX72_9AGAM|nr:hypothetical protein BS47DRAFT_1338437 [Hydnum rufescens UP504]